MSKSYLLALSILAALLTSISLPGWGQGGSVAHGYRADPADAAEPVANVVRPSSFAAYRGFTEQEVKDWRESNDNVGRIGGWRAYARESRDSKPDAAVPAVSAPSAGASDAHQHH